VPAVGDLSADGTHVWGGHTWEPLSLVSGEVVDAARVCFGRDASAPPTFMTEGLMNESWRIDSPDGAYVLRVSRSDLSREQVRYEHAVTGQLHDTVREVVAPLLGRDGETLQTWQGRDLSLFPYIDGVLGTDVEPATRWQQAATILARIHRASTSLAVGRPPDQSRMVDEQPTMWSTVRPVLERELPPTAEVGKLLSFFDSEAAALEAWLDSLRRSGRQLRRGVVHGDFNPRNMIFSQDRLVALIDWEHCHLDALAYETAGVALEAPDPLAFWRAYLDADGPLNADDIDLFDGFARIGTLTGLYFTTDGGDRAKPWAIEILREVADGMGQLRERISGLGLSRGLPRG
jgi:Ser/Thr protein kinase RdoA (MazF antagonist)